MFIAFFLGIAPFLNLMIQKENYESYPKSFEFYSCENIFLKSLSSRGQKNEISRRDRTSGEKAQTEVKT